MFGLFKPKQAPDGPVQFALSIAIACSPEEVFGLIDWADARNAKRQLGYAVIEVAPGRFRMVIPSMPEFTFDMIETEIRLGEVYAFDCRITPMIGRLLRSHERYSFVADGGSSCTVSLVNTVEFEPGMRLSDFQCELGKMAASTQSALEKFKIHAEYGLDAVRAVENRLVI